MSFSDMFSLVGRTPHVRVNSRDLSGVRVYVKMESYNPTGSIKDRACVSLIRDKIGRRELMKGKTLLDASSDNMACSIAYFGKVLGYPSRLFSNSKLTTDKRQFIEYFGAELDITGTFTIEGNRDLRRTSDRSCLFCVPRCSSRRRCYGRCRIPLWR